MLRVSHRRLSLLTFNRPVISFMNGRVLVDLRWACKARFAPSKSRLALPLRAQGLPLLLSFT